MIIQYDELKLYFRESYTINDNVRLMQPTIGDIVSYGEQKYYSMAQTLTAIPSDMKSVLDDMGIDYEELTDFELFILVSKNLTKEDTYLLLGDLDLSHFDITKNIENDETVLYDCDNDIVIDQLIYQKIADYIRALHGFKVKVEKSANKFTKKILIDEDREKRLLNPKKEFHSVLLPLISSMVNSAGFKYNASQLSEVGIYEFMDSVKRIATIKNVEALMSGIYAGNIDSSQINKSELDWMK